MSATIFYHRDAMNMGYYFNTGVLQFRNGFLITHDDHVKAFFRNHADFGKKEDGALLFESDTPIVVKRTTAEKEADRSQPKAWKPTGVQMLYPTDGMYFVCDKDGTRHLMLAGMLAHIKNVHGEEYLRSMKVMRTAPKVKRFGPTEVTPLPTDITKDDIEMTVPPCVGPYPKKAVINNAKPLPTEKVQEGVGTPAIEKTLKNQ